MTDTGTKHLEIELVGSTRDGRTISVHREMSHVCIPVQAGMLVIWPATALLSPDRVAFRTETYRIDWDQRKGFLV